MRVLALHLPQFHEVRENNEWWGEGFTEWVSVRGAEPIYPGHRQPVHPLGGNYYDLTNPESLVWQARTAKDHGVDGFVFFHYWYSGKLLLERPVELWRDLPEADLGYCLCWANHPWTRSWDGKEHEILQAQTYGGQDDWDAHLDYLLTFFRDGRYIQRDGKPVLFLYNAGAVPDVDAMVAHWEGRLVEEGFNGLHVVEYISSKNPAPACERSAAVYEDEPIYTLRFEISPLAKARRVIAKWLQRPDFQRYDDIWHRILRKRRRYGGREIVQGGFVAWDNSPRRGRRGPMIVLGSSPAKFEFYFRQLMSGDRQDASDEFVLINAWNEWGEGAVLEPSEEDGHGYLDAVRRVVSERESQAEGSTPHV